MLSEILLIGMLVGSAVDLGTTEYGLKYPGIHEANPLMRNRGVRITVNIAAPLCLYRLIKDKNKKTQLIVAGSYIGIKAFAGVHNYKVIQKVKGGKQ